MKFARKTFAILMTGALTVGLMAGCDKLPGMQRLLAVPLLHRRRPAPPVLITAPRLMKTGCGRALPRWTM